MKIYFVSDTHNKHQRLNIPDCDLMIYCGDCSSHGSLSINSNEVYDFLDWMEQIPCTKCMIAGNHDVSIHRKLMKRSDIERRGIIYLEHESREINGLNIFGSPYTPNYSSTHDAFTYKRHKGQSLWQSIPDNTDILVTHGPPKTVLDLNLDLERRKSNELVEFTGCKALLNRVHEVKPKIHAFGHIHEQSGRKLIEGDVTFLNCCISNHSWKKIFNGHIESIC